MVRRYRARLPVYDGLDWIERGMSSAQFLAERARKRKEAFNADMERIRNSAMKYLRSNGPTEFNILAGAIKATKGRMAFAGIMIAKEGILHRYRCNEGRKSFRVWALSPKAVLVREKREKKSKVDICITEDDIQWMETWKNHRANKRKIYENHP